MKKYLPQVRALSQEWYFAHILRNTLEENPQLYEDFITNALEVGVLKKDNFNKIFRSSYELDVVIGLMMESFIVSKANNDIRVLKALFKISSKSNKSHSNNYIAQFEPIGTGFLSTKIKYPHFYNPNDNSDILFLRHSKCKKVEPALIIKSNHYANVQIKAIRSERSLYNNIVRPLITEKYSCVLTCLRFDEDTHTKNKCYEIIDELKDEGKLTIDKQKYSFNKDVRKRIKSSIHCPEDINIEQNEVDTYYEFIEAWFHGEKGLKQHEFYENICLAIKLLNQQIQGYVNSFTFKVEESPM